MTAPLDLGALALRGRDVLLRPLSEGDAPALAAAASESRSHYGFNPVPEGLEGTHAAIARALRQRAAGVRYPFAVVWNDRLVGTTSYYEYQPWEWPPDVGRQRRAVPDVVEIGFTWLAASAQRTRCNTESKWLLLRHAFEEWRVHRVSLRTDERNQRSRRAIERLGAQLDGIRRADMPGRDGTVRNSAFYSIVLAEWPEVRQRLQKLLY